MKLVKDTDRLEKKKHEISEEKAEEAIRTIIQWIGEDPKREGLLSTPKRVVNAFKEYFKGYAPTTASTKPIAKRTGVMPPTYIRLNISTGSVLSPPADRNSAIVTLLNDMMKAKVKDK